MYQVAFVMEQILGHQRGEKLENVVNPDCEIHRPRGSLSMALNGWAEGSRWTGGTGMSGRTTCPPMSRNVQLAHLD